MADLDLKAIRNSLVELSRQAGRMIIDSYYSQNFSTDTKMNCKSTSILALIPPSHAKVRHI